MTENQPGKTIDEVWLFISRESGEEGVVAEQMNGMWYPLIAADHLRVDLLRPLAQTVATRTQSPITLRYFGPKGVHDIEVLEP